mmetsp:Transcript_36164/g.89103  ORF Transcript_36164/g.89103 Transcript_36164/m.89103 type:complete len:526 (-) Transcript_36164:476-2053(-)
MGCLNSVPENKGAAGKPTSAPGGAAAKPHAHGAKAPQVLQRSGSVLGRDTEDVNDHYTFHEELGKGQFGTTYLVTHKKTGERAACKAIAKRKLQSKDDIEDVRREVSILHHLNGHPNIVGLKAAYEGSKHVYIVMDLCTGGELFDRIVERGHYSEKDAAGIFRTMMRTISHCHNLGVIHRDLKPENFVLVTKADDAPINAIDFGLSTFFEPDQQFHDIVGSAYYVAPEVLRRQYSHEADIWSAGVILYILLSGVPPFWAQSENGIFEAVLKGKYDLKSDPWDKISEGAKDVIRKMLHPKPKERIKASEVLNHPWVREDGDAGDQKLDNIVLSRMKNFANINKFKKMGLMAIAKTLTAEEIMGLKELFHSFDTDNSGTITIDELKVGLEKKGAKTASDELVHLMKSIDMDGSGELDYEEFVAAMLSMTKLTNEDNIARAFAYFDADGSGYITLSELRAVMKDFQMKGGLGGVVTDKDVDEFMKAADKDNDGRIDYDEFLAMMTERDKSSLNTQTKLKKRLSLGGYA